MKSFFHLPAGITGKIQINRKNKESELKSASKPDVPEKTTSYRRIYLVDFENVGTEGIDHADALGKEDFVHLFCTRNSAKICPSILAGFNSTNLITHVVPQGDQSVDMHIVTYLGFMLGKKNPGDVFVIISKDKDYDNVITFWKEEHDMDVKRIECLAADKKTMKAPNGKNVSDGAKISNELSVQTKQQNVISGQPQQANTKQTNSQLPSATDAAKQQTSAANTAKQQTSAANTTKQQASNVKTAKTTTASVGASEKQRIAKEKTELNNAVTKALSKAKYDSKIIGFVSSQAVKHFSDANRKQKMHTVIVQKYGQDKGLKIYKCIRQYL